MKTLQRWSTVVLALVLGAIGASRLGTFLHEFLGHGLAVELFGGEFQRGTVSWFGGGFAYYRIPDDLDVSALWWISWSGILLNIAIGIVFLSLATVRSGKRGETLCLFLGGCNLLAGLHYWLLGAYWSAGDPVEWARSSVEVSQAESVWWIALVGLAPLGLWCVARIRHWLERRLPMADGWARLRLGVTALLAAAVVYGGLFVIGQQDILVLKGGREAESRLVARTREVEAQKRTTPPTRPKPAVQPDPKSATVQPESEPEPLRSPYAVLIYLGLVYALWLGFFVRGSRREDAEPAEWEPMDLMEVGGLAVLGLLLAWMF